MMKFVAAIFLFSFMLASCGPQLIFTEPQPQGKKDESGFKRKYQGDFLLERDSTLALSLHNNLLVIRQKMDIAEPLTFFDSSEGWWLREGKLYGSLIEGDGVPVTLHNDSVFGRVTMMDTLFAVGDGQVLRYHQGRYFLNTLVAAGEWQVRSLWLENDQLILADINYAEDIEKMKELELVEEIQSDSGEVTAYRASPSRKQLSDYLSTGGFSHRDTFRRIE